MSPPVSAFQNALIVLCTLTLLACAPSSGGQTGSELSITDTEEFVERRIDGDSPVWGQAPYLFEGPFACPIPLEALEIQVPQAHEAFVIHNDGDTRSLEIRLEGSSFDAELTAEPLLLVYPGSKMPEEGADVSACLGIAKPGGGTPGSVTVSVEPGQSVMAIATELEISPGSGGSGSGTFRLRVVP